MLLIFHLLNSFENINHISMLLIQLESRIKKQECNMDQFHGKISFLKNNDNIVKKDFSATAN